MARLAALLTLALAACGPAHPTPAAPPPPPPLSAADTALAAQLDTAAQAVLAARPYAGLSVAVLRHGTVIFARGYGQADRAAKTPAAADTIYRYASISKSFTAAAILELARQGKLAIDDPVTRYVPDTETHGKTITLRQLLGHTSGIKDYTEIDAFVKHMAEPMSRAALVDLFDAEPLNFEPGSRWSYSNSGYYLLGLVIEKVTGEPYADAVKRLVITPAGLPDTAYCPQTMTGAREARPYRTVDGALTDATAIDMAHPYAAGSLCGTAPDLVHWLDALANHRGVDAGLWPQMITPVTLTDGTHFNYGMGLQVSQWKGHRRVGHNGGINGFGSQMDDYPDDDLVIAAIDNDESSLATEVAERLARVALAIPEDKLLDLPISAADGPRYVGTFDFPEAQIKLAIRFENGVLEAGNLDPQGQVGRWLRLRSQGERVFEIPEVQARLTFVVEGDRATALDVEQSAATLHGTRVP
ncbi:MAG: beta-lactamase family protein [Deltaproteobacteria bacterium]|nr:beta-lactamase family protein [Deltaproteobacteria bacterium]